MALIQRYAGIIQGGILLTGNSLTCKNAGTNPPGGDYYNGAYISTNESLVAGTGFPKGTSYSATNNSSSAVVSIPSGSIILYAQLFWIVTGPVGNTDASINFTTPITSTSIPPNLALKQSSSTQFWQAADVTNLIQNGGSGTYTVGNVPGITISNNTSICSNGWSLIIVYQNSASKTRYVNVNTGLSPTSSSTPSQFTFTGFVAPSSGPVKAYFLVSDYNGDINDKAEIFIGATSISNSTIGNTSNPWNTAPPFAYYQNMLPGNILIADPNNPDIGLLDTSGTFGSYNKNPFTPSAPSYCRTNYDIAGFDISSKINNSQNSLYTKVTFVGSGTSAITSQSVQVDVNSASISAGKLVDKTTAYPNDELTYSMILNNDGLLDALDVFVIDTIPIGTSFVSGSLNVNNTTVSGSPLPPGGYLVGTIPYGTVTTVTFKVTVTTIPAVPTTLVNSYSISYKFIPITIPQTSFAQSNSVTTTIPAPVLIDIHKTANKSYVDIGDYITYTFTIPNTGIVDAGNVIFVDTIPIGASYVGNSFILNNTSIPGANPQSGVNIGTIAAGSTSTVSFIVQVTTLPTINPLNNNGTAFFKSYGVTPMSYDSNTVQTKVNHASLLLNKTNSPNYADLGTTITYTILVNNTGSTSATNVVFIDTVPAGTTFINGSFSINGSTIPNNPTPPGINLGTLPVGITTLSFKVTVNTIPTINPIKNSATTTFNYTIDPCVPNGGSSGTNSNTSYVQVNNAQLTLKKLVDKSYATCSDTLKYVIEITNTGNVCATNIMFKDTLPNGTQFISNSFTLDGVTISSANPSNGVTLNTISVGSTSTLTFKVQVLC